MGSLRDFFLKNNSVSQTVFKNVAWLFSGEIFGRVIRFVLVVYSARLLGAAEYGVFSYALSIAALLTLLSDFGIGAMVTREVSKDPENQQEYFSTAFAVKVILLIFSALLAFFLIPVITKLPSVSVLVPLIILIFMFDSLREFGFGMSRALERMEREALIKVFLNLVVVGLGFYILFTSPSAYNLLLAYVVGAGLACVVTAIVLFPFLARIFSAINWKKAWPFFAAAWPLGLLQVLGAVLLNTDMVMLGWWETETAIGLYAAANKIILLLYVLPNLISASVFPTFARLVKNNKERFVLVFEKVIGLTFLLSVPMVIGGVLVADEMIDFLYAAEYSGSVTTLLLLLPTLLVVFPSTVFANALFALNEQKKFIGFVLVGVLSNALFNWLLIPSYGIEGVAISTIGSQILTNFFVWRTLYKVAPFSVTRYMPRILIAGLVMGVFTLLLVSHLPFLLVLVVSGIIYGSALLLLRDPLLGFVVSIISKKA